MKLAAYGGNAIPNLGSCQVFLNYPNNPYPKSVQTEIVDVDSPAVIGNMSAQSLNLLKLKLTVAVESNSKPATQSLKLYDVRGTPHPFPLTKEYLLNEYQDLFIGVGCFPGLPCHVETDPYISPVQQPPEASPSLTARCLPRRAGTIKARRYPWTRAQWIHAMGQLYCGYKEAKWNNSPLPPVT